MAAHDAPTPKQLASYAPSPRTGQNFAGPRTRRQPSCEIARLLVPASCPDWERRADRHAVAGPGATQHDATRFRREEVQGYGAWARWAGR